MLEKLLAVPVIQGILRVFGRPKLRLSFDPSDTECRQAVTDYWPVNIVNTDGEVVRRETDSADAVYLRCYVENIGRSAQADGVSVYITSVEFGSQRKTRVGFRAQWAHHGGDKQRRFEPRPIFVGVPLSVDICRANAKHRELVFLTEPQPTFRERGRYTVTLRATGTNWVSPGLLVLDVDFDPERIAQLTGTVRQERSPFRTA